MKKCKVLRSEPQLEDLRGIVIIDLCTEDLRDDFELITRELKCKEVPDEIIGLVGREEGLVWFPAEGHGGGAPPGNRRLGVAERK